MSRRPWMPLFTTDYLGDTHHLTLEQHGAYMLMIMHYWNHGGPISDEQQIKQLLGLHSVTGANRWRSICLAIAPMFQDGWRLPKLDALIEKANSISEKRSLSGFKGGSISRGKDNNGRFIHAKQMPSKRATDTRKIDTSLTSSLSDSPPSQLREIAHDPLLASALPDGRARSGSNGKAPAQVTRAELDEIIESKRNHNTPTVSPSDDIEEIPF